mgnify:CR=1 FL=1
MIKKKAASRIRLQRKEISWIIDGDFALYKFGKVSSLAQRYEKTL